MYLLLHIFIYFLKHKLRHLLLLLVAWPLETKDGLFMIKIMTWRETGEEKPELPVKL